MLTLARFAALVLGLGAASLARAGTPPLPPPDGMKAIPVAPAPPPGAASGAPASGAPGTAAGERCTGCHAALQQKRVIHGALQKHECTACHRPVTAEKGKCQAKTATKWALVRTEPDLCYGCHARKDQSKSVHTAVRQGSCLSCHDAHSSDWAGLTNEPREKLCFSCHEPEPLLTKRVKHAPVTEGRCLECHDAHGGDLPNAIKAASGTAFCLKCHDAKAPTGKGTPGPAYRVDLSKPTVHPAMKRVECTGCHDSGHSGDFPKLLKKNPVDLCYGCHERKDKAKFPHGAVLVGDCSVCHEPHSSDQPKLLAKPTTQANCFICHQDDLTGRKVIHAPVAKGCETCHDAHGANDRSALKFGSGKAFCYKCHKPMDDVKVKHAALERYGCTGCHDPHASGNRFLVASAVNALCAKCHPDQADGRHVSPMVRNGHVVGGNLRDPRRTDHAFTCASCHNPHGSDNPRLFYYGDNTMQSCDGCHGDKSGQHPELKNVISRAKPPAAAPATAGNGPGVAPGAAGGGAGVAPGAGGGSPSPGGGGEGLPTGPPRF